MGIIVNGIKLEILPCHNNALLHRGISWFTRTHLYFFTGSHFASLDEPVNSFVSEKLWARIEINRKINRRNQPAPPFHSIYQLRWAPTMSNKIPFTMMGNILPLSERISLHYGRLRFCTTAHYKNFPGQQKTS